jgi:aspartate/methionine/tyrosine aminotransferase
VAQLLVKWTLGKLVDKKINEAHVVITRGIGFVPRGRLSCFRISAFGPRENII